MTDDHDDRDPIAAAVADYRRAPRDVVPRTPRDIGKDLAELATLAGTMLEIAHYETTKHGVTRMTERNTIEIFNPNIGA
jgi:hypothetical protein